MTAQPSESEASPQPRRAAVALRIGGILLAGCMIGAAAIVPYQVHLLRAVQPQLVDQAPPLGLMMGTAMLGASLLFGAAIAIGLWLRRWTGIGMPYLEPVVRGRPLPSLAPLGTAAAIGLGAGLLVRALDALFALTMLDIAPVPLWTRALAIVYGAINEEVLSRLCIMSALFLAFGVLMRNRRAAEWWAIITAALVFGLLHLPFTEALVPLTPAIVFRGLLLNGIAGTVFGWLCWRYGFEAAMAGHLAAGVALHLLGPF